MEKRDKQSLKPSVIVIMGVSGSGKTTVGTLLAQTLGWQFADADQFHPPANVEKMSRCQPLTDADRTPWLNALQAAIKNWLADDRRVVLACSALKQSYRDILQVDPERVAFAYLKGDFNTIEKRLGGRQGHFMKADLLHSQIETLEEPQNAIVLDAAPKPDQIVANLINLLGFH